VVTYLADFTIYLNGAEAVQTSETEDFVYTIPIVTVKSQYACVHWNKDDDVWETDSCSVASSTDTEITCSCKQTGVVAAIEYTAPDNGGNGGNTDKSGANLYASIMTIFMMVVVALWN